MANYQTLKSAIQQVIKQNGNNEITGALLQQTLLAMVTSLGENYQYRGIAVPTTNPGIPDQYVFYLATQVGNYPNFTSGDGTGTLSVGEEEVAIFKFNGTYWSKEITGIPSQTTVSILKDDVNLALSKIYTFRDVLPIEEESNVRQNIYGNVSASSGWLMRIYTIESGKEYYANGRVPSTASIPSNSCLINYFDDEDNFIGYEERSVGEPVAYNKQKLTIPNGATKIRVQGSTVYDYAPQLFEDLGLTLTDVNNKVDKIESNKLKAIQPTIERGAITSSTGLFATTDANKTYWRTPNYVKVSDNQKIGLRVTNESCSIRVDCYDGNYTLLGNTGGFISHSVDAIVYHSLLDGTAFVRLTVRNNGPVIQIPKPIIIITGLFDETFEYKNIRPTDGYQKLIIPIQVAHPNSSDLETNDVQDSEEILSDFGLLALPKQYCNVGNGTRLIIYCHGAGVNYDSSIERFPETDLLPEYWLSEGYAIMDIEGNPFNNTDEHFYTPQALQCYLAAYDWVTNVFNIRKDGVFVGGRSMGGGMVFELLQSRIPIIAACPCVPACNQLWIWEYANASRRSFMAAKMGCVGDVTWTSSTPMSDAEFEYLQTNFDKIVKYSPLWRGIENLPTKEELFGVGNIAATAQTNATEKALYDTLHFKVKSPVKIFAAKDDTTVPYQRNAKYMYQMLLNAAQICELRLFNSGGHHFEIENPDCLTTIVNSYGETIVGVPIVYIEMLRFWRRYEL